MSAGLERSLYGLLPVDVFEFIQGSSAWRYASGDQAQTCLGETYLPRAIARKEISQGQEASSGTVEITLPSTDPVVALFIGPLPPSSVSVTIRQLQRGALQNPSIFAGVVSGLVSIVGAVATLRCISLDQILERQAPALTWQTYCNLVLYGTRCGLTAADWRVTGLVAAVTGLTVRVSGLTGYADDWFRAGWIENAAGERRSIRAHVGDTLTINARFAGLDPGDAVSVYAGCQCTEADCRDKFDNLAHFWGFPRMPIRNPFAGTY